MFRGVRVPYLVASVWLATACGGDPPAEEISCKAAGACTISLVSGDAQSQTVGAALGQPLTLKISHTSGQPLPVMTISWKVIEGGGTITPATSMTDSTGQASAQATV